MRATINFDVDVTRVAETMRCLALEEALGIQRTLESLEALENDNLVHDLDEVVQKLRSATRQLEQYKDMLVSFERARFETMTPQPADTNPELTEALEQPDPNRLSNFAQVQGAFGAVQDFESFMSQVGQDGSDTTGATNDESDGSNEEG